MRTLAPVTAERVEVSDRKNDEFTAK